MSRFNVKKVAVLGAGVMGAQIAILFAPMLTLSGVTKSYGDRVLFADAALQVNRGDRIGLVGPNGAGKSTLFGLILKEEPRRPAGLGSGPCQCGFCGRGHRLAVARAVTDGGALQERLFYRVACGWPDG